MKLDHRLSLDREPEPEPETAWVYVTGESELLRCVRYIHALLAYFEASLDTVFGVVKRHKFESRLRAFHSGPSKDDQAWYALRNTVYAYGCKITLAGQLHAGAFSQAQDRAWKYFENALSVHTELIYMHSDIDAIEALMAMVCCFKTRTSHNNAENLHTGLLH